MNFIWIVIPGSKSIIALALIFSDNHHSVDLPERGAICVRHSDSSENAVYDHQEGPIDVDMGGNWFD